MPLNINHDTLLQEAFNLELETRHPPLPSLVHVDPTKIVGTIRTLTTQQKSVLR